MQNCTHTCTCITYTDPQTHIHMNILLIITILASYIHVATVRTLLALE